MTTKFLIPPAVLFSILMMVLAINFLTKPDIALASSSTTNQPEMNIQNNSNTCSLSQYFPESVQQWCQLIEENATAVSLDPNLVAAVILQESGGNPSVISHSGAVGLMQVMPNDGIAASFQCINGPCFASRPSSNQLMDPAYNVRFGTQMLANLTAKHGNIRDALYAYGPMSVGYSYADIILQILHNAVG